MTIHLLRRGPLSPMQVLSAMLDDPDLSQVDALAIVVVHNNGDMHVNHSDTLNSTLIAMGAVLVDLGVNKIKSG